MGFELWSPSGWGLEDKAYTLTGVGGRVLRGKEANLARLGIGDPEIGPASPGSLTGRVDSAMEAGEKPWGSGPKRPPKVLHHFSPNVSHLVKSRARAHIPGGGKLGDPVSTDQAKQN